VIIKQNLSR